MRDCNPIDCHAYATTRHPPRLAAFVEKDVGCNERRRQADGSCAPSARSMLSARCIHVQTYGRVEIASRSTQVHTHSN